MKMGTSTPKTKVCKQCGVDKALTLYTKQKLGRRSKCKECLLVEQNNYREANREEVNKRARAYRKANPEMFKERDKKFNEAEGRLEKRRMWYYENKAKYKETRDTWKADNSGKLKASYVKQNAKRSLRVPNWLTELDLFKIECIYERAKELSEYFGTPMHVDHIIPLVGKKVSGFHCPENLEIVPAEYNLRKANKFIPYFESERKELIWQ